MTDSATTNQNPWKEALIDALVCNFILNEQNQKDPRRAIKDLIEWEHKLANDPLVSTLYPKDEEFIAMAQTIPEKDMYCSDGQYIVTREGLIAYARAILTLLTQRI